LQEKYKPRSVVLHDQYFDRTSQRSNNTFFGEGIVGHVGFADPISKNLREILYQAGKEEEVDIHNGGTYVCMDGPAFSTRAESNFYRAQGFDVIGMTNLPEAKLAREAEIALASLAMVTDYDCWREGSEAVDVSEVSSHLAANLKTSTKIIRRAISQIPSEPTWPEHSSLDNAILTPTHHWPEETIEKISPILGHRGEFRDE